MLRASELQLLHGLAAGNEEDEAKRSMPDRDVAETNSDAGLTVRARLKIGCRLPIILFSVTTAAATRDIFLLLLLPSF